MQLSHQDKLKIREENASVVSFETTNYVIENKVEKCNNADDLSEKFLPYNKRDIPCQV